MKVCVLALLVVFIGACSSGGRRSGSSGPTSTTTTASTPAACHSGARVVPARDAPNDVVTWASDKGVVGDGALWTVRSALDVPARYQQGHWSLKFPWYTRPFGIPMVSARRTDGAGTFRFDASGAQDSSGMWVASNLVFSTSGCWAVTARFETSTIRFRLHVGS